MDIKQNFSSDTNDFLDNESLDTSNIHVFDHILIEDADTDEVLVDKRG